MTAIHARPGQADADLDVDGARRPAVHPDAHATDAAHAPASPILGRPDPRLAGAGSAAAGLMALQRTAGNAAVASLLAPSATVQRENVQIDELTTRVDVSDTAAGAAGAAGATGSGAGGAVTSDGSTTTINGSVIDLAAPMTQTDGVIRAGTIIADSVVASSYSPGAGNVW
jgi:hypothetical protein